MTDQSLQTASRADQQNRHSHVVEHSNRTRGCRTLVIGGGRKPCRKVVPGRSVDAGPAVLMSITLGTLSIHQPSFRHSERPTTSDLALTTSCSIRGSSIFSGVFPFMLLISAVG